MPRPLKILFSLLLAAYLAAAAVMASHDETAPGAAMCTGMSISVETAPGDGDPQGQASRFVSPAELERELDSLPSRARSIALGNINTQHIRRTLLALDKLEDATVVRYTDGSIRIKARPIVPVMRVFDKEESYYVNRSGKRVKASARYRKNVPVVHGHFDPADSSFTPLSLLPLLETLAADSVWATYFGAVKVLSPTDVLLLPNIREHVVNIGAPGGIQAKLDDLSLFYNRVLSRQGWEKYDTISLKWRGQIVAVKRHRPPAQLPVVNHDDDEAVAIDAMLAGEGVAPGQTEPGRQAHSSTPIPAKNNG